MANIGEKVFGLDDLSDEQVIPLLLFMDSDTLLNCGRASERLFKLVSDRQVWRQLLKKIPEFSKSKVQELKGLQSPQGSKVSLEMVQEVAMEVARRIQFSEHLFLSTCDLGELEGEERAKAIQDMVKIMKEQIKVTVSVEAGWGNSVFVVEGWRLEELTALAKVVDVKIKLTKVEFPSMPHMGILKEISSHMEQQMEQLEELKVSLLELSNEPPREDNTHGDLHMEREATNLYMSLMSRANSWEIDTLTLAQSGTHLWTRLADIPGGTIGTICFPPLGPQNTLDPMSLDPLKKLWMTCDCAVAPMINNFNFNFSSFQGGRISGLNIEAEWQRILDIMI